MKQNNVQLNPAQIAAALAPQKQKYLEWGRGTGKTTYLGYDFSQLLKQMPRASFAIVGSTYSQILSRFLPAIKEGLELFGIYENIDFVVGSMAGKKMGYKLPFQPPDAFNNIIHFSNGCIFQMVSLDHKDSGRGLNSYAIRGDEAALFDDEKLAINVKNTNRAKKAIFKRAPLLHSEVFTSSTPLTQKGKWFTDMEEKARLNPTDIAFIKATAHCNLHNLRSDYFEYMKQSYTNEVIYKAEMLNIRPKEITDGYYAQLNPEIHYYTDHNNAYLESLDLKQPSSRNFNSKQDNDVNPTMPLIVSVDWGANINTLSVSQLQDNTYKVLNAFYVKSPKILDHLFLEKFIPYYEPHPNKVIKLYYDHTGNSRVANSKLTFAEQAREILRNAGWKVHLMTTGSNPDYLDKFRLINVMLKDDGRTNLPRIRINESNCQDLIISLERAEIRDTSQGLKKDKRSEQRKGVEQQHATHFSDTFDYPLYALFNEKFKNRSKSSSDLPNSTF
ncbi:hypothetical protein CL622_05105 [archaeon]|nr:hypothetical protein [archaeon]